MEFNHCHQQVKFSTAPAAPDTHWLQTTFLLKKNYQLGTGQRMKGIFRLFRDKEDSRSLDIKIGFIVEVCYENFSFEFFYKWNYIFSKILAYWRKTLTSCTEKITFKLETNGLILDTLLN